MSENTRALSVQRPFTLEDAMGTLERALAAVRTTNTAADWAAVDDALSLFKDPLDGGSLSMPDLEDSFFKFMGSEVMRNVFELKDTQPTQLNAQAIETATTVWARVVECIECSREVNDRFRQERGSPCSAPYSLGSLSPIPRASLSPTSTTSLSALRKCN